MREDICIHIMVLKVLSGASAEPAFVYTSRRPPPSPYGGGFLHASE